MVDVVVRRARARLAILRRVPAARASGASGVVPDDRERARRDRARRLDQHERDAGLLDVNRVVVRPLAGLDPPAARPVVERAVTLASAPLEAVDFAPVYFLGVAEADEVFTRAALGLIGTKPDELAASHILLLWRSASQLPQETRL